jgi:hypothetical protein
MKVIYRVHAVRRMFERGIRDSDVRAALEKNEEIATYSDDKPYPSRLLLGWRDDRPLHVVAAFNAADDEQVVITVYEPDSAQWEDGFRRRKT